MDLDEQLLLYITKNSLFEKLSGRKRGVEDIYSFFRKRGCWGLETLYKLKRYRFYN